VTATPYGPTPTVIGEPTTVLLAVSITETVLLPVLVTYMAATGQAQAEATKEAQRAGIAHAKANGDARTYKGRKPSYSRKEFENAQALLDKSVSVGEVARTTGLTRQTVYRIKDDPGGAEAALATWGM
jgi:putative DNA-invertase from lambdoid prophage Rac